MNEEARRRLLSLFIEEKNERIETRETREMDQLERERDFGEGSSKVEPASKCKLESSSDTESISVSDSEIECSVEESEFTSEESDDSDCSSQVSVIMRAPKTAVLNWLKGIEVSEDNKVKGANEIGNPRQHSHDREGDDTSGEETAVVNWLRGIQGEKNGASRANHQLGNLSQRASDGGRGDEDASREKCKSPSGSNLKIGTSNSKIENDVAISPKIQSPCNHQHSFDFVEEEMTFIINVMPEEQTFEPLYKEHSEELSLSADFTSELPLTTFAPHRVDQTPESSLATEVEKERQLYTKENKKPSSLVEKRLSCINEEEEPRQRQQLEIESVSLPKNSQIDGGNKNSSTEGEEICNLPENEEENTNEEDSESSKLWRRGRGEDGSDNKDPSCQHDQNKDKSREAGTCTNDEPRNTDQEPSISLESLSLSCYELEDVEEHEFEYLEVENKIESFQGSIGFAIFRRKN